MTTSDHTKFQQLSMEDLPDEVLVQIFSFLHGNDILNLADVSKRFSRICCEKRVVSYMNFQRCYHMDVCNLKMFLRNKMRCLNIREVNFNGCYWLSYNQLKPLTKLKNLKGLHILQCRVTWDLLPNLLKGFCLESFSWTWSERNGASLTPTEFQLKTETPLSCLKVLSIEVSNPFHLSYIWLILSCTPKLEELEVSKSQFLMRNVVDMIHKFKNWNASPEIFTENLRCLKKCKIYLKSNMGFMVKDFIKRIFAASFMKNSKIGGFWSLEAGCKVLGELNQEFQQTFDQIADAQYLSLSGKRARFLNPPNSYGDQLVFAKNVLNLGLPKCKCLSLDLQRIDGDLLELVGNNCSKIECLSLMQVHISISTFADGFAKVCELCTNISELCLLNTHLHLEENMCIHIANLKFLKVLSLSTCALASPPSPSPPSPAVMRSEGEDDKQQSNPILHIRQRKGLPSRPTDDEINQSRLFQVAQNCKSLTTLIIRTNECNSLACENLLFAVKDSDLFCISQMTKLSHLELGEMPGIRHGQFLVEISQKCCLQKLCLSEVGPKGRMVYHNAFVAALNLCKDLKHLKVEQKYDLRLLGLKDSLLKCQNLESLKIISEGGPPSHYDNHPVIEVADKLSNLMDLYLIQPMSKEDCKRTTHHLQQMLKDVRPAFRCEIRNCQKGEMNNGDFRKLPLYLA